MPQRIHESAVRNFQSAADLLIAIQGRRLVLTSEAARVLNSRPKAILNEGYSTLSPRFGICIPQSSRAEFAFAGDGEGLDFRTSSLPWMTMEGLLDGKMAGTCYVDADVAFLVPTTADVFLREFTADGKSHDSQHTEWSLGTDQAAVCVMNIPKADNDVESRRVIIHLRQPPERFILRKLALTLI